MSPGVSPFSPSIPCTSDACDRIDSPVGHKHSACTPDLTGKSLLTFSALNTFRNCPRKYKHRYIDQLQGRERADTLAFGSLIHAALETWYRATDDADRLWTILDDLDRAYPNRAGDPHAKRTWQLARAMVSGYAARYPQEDFEVVEVEKVFQAEIRNPDTGRPSQTFVMAGKVDGIVRLDGELYLLEHKTAGSIDANYLDKLWTDTQIALYSHYLRELGSPIVGVIYNVLLKTRIQQHAGESQEEYEARRAVLAAKNKSGRSTAKRQLPETDDEFQARLAEWYAKPEAFHRERIYLSEDRLAMLQDEVWEITQQYLDARRRGKWLLNTSNCFSFQRPCAYLPYCQSGFNPNVRDNLFEIRPPHEELEGLDDAATGETLENPF
ncbi:MAG: PD-(D/E)XK nuclease family protein [Phycisphaerae bacterium]|nr:PD-(D/E)XK nuclease family protein [Phycisphaerae bacterium]